MTRSKREMVHWHDYGDGPDRVHHTHRGGDMSHEHQPLFPGYYRAAKNPVMTLPKPSLGLGNGFSVGGGNGNGHGAPTAKELFSLPKHIFQPFYGGVNAIASIPPPQPVSVAGKKMWRIPIVKIKRPSIHMPHVSRPSIPRIHIPRPSVKFPSIQTRTLTRVSPQIKVVPWTEQVRVPYRPQTQVGVTRSYAGGYPPAPVRRAYPQRRRRRRSTGGENYMLPFLIFLLIVGVGYGVYRSEKNSQQGVI